MKKEWGFPGDSVVKNLPANAGDRRHRFYTWVRKIPWWRKWQPIQCSCLESSMSSKLDRLQSMGSQRVRCCQSVQSLSHVRLFVTPNCIMPGLPIHHQLLEFTQNLCPLNRWCHPTTSSSIIPFSSHLQSFPALGSFPMSQLFTSGGQSTEVSASTSVLPMNVQDLFPSIWTGWISLQSKGLSRVFSNTTVQKHQFFAAHFSL